MTQTKKYAIRCSSEEETIECRRHGLYNYLDVYDIKDNRYNEKMDICAYYLNHGYTLISYKEAVEMGLLREHNQKSIHKTVDIKNPSDHCPICNGLFNRVDNYCAGCGAKINWIE